MPTSATPAKLLLLWDVDHTLIETGSLGSAIFADAFRMATGREMELLADVSGRTEPDIFNETVKLHDIDTSGVSFERFAEHQADGYRTRADELRHRGRVLPGVAEALAAFGKMPTVVQSLLTGNTRPAAQIKLETFGLADDIDFEAGAYGTDDSTRAHLVDVAQRRASERYAAHFDDQTTVLIGDTPNDVVAGLEGGAVVIAVASGKSTVHDLTEAGAHVVLPDLTDLHEVVRAVTGIATRTSG